MGMPARRPDTKSYRLVDLGRRYLRIGAGGVDTAYGRRLIVNTNAVAAVFFVAILAHALILISPPVDMPQAAAVALLTALSLIAVPWLNARGRHRVAPLLAIGISIAGLLAEIVFFDGVALSLHFNFLLIAGLAVIFVGLDKPLRLGAVLSLNLLLFLLCETGVIANINRTVVIGDDAVRLLRFTTILSVVITVSVFLVLSERTARRSETALERLAATDSLTGIPNRMSFINATRREIARTERAGESLALMVMDIDYFKRINDTHGHPVGDDVLRIVGQGLASLLRSQDLVARVGGEEFAICCSGTEGQSLLELCERIRRHFGESVVRTYRGDVSLTVSIGVAEREPGEPYEALFARADAALYASKRGGRNQVTAAAVAAQPVVQERSSAAG
jgi:diguanylate cyclase (GGDEF)-like protein